VLKKKRGLNVGFWALGVAFSFDVGVVFDLGPFWLGYVFEYAIAQKRGH
jgi:hypothetical protein